MARMSITFEGFKELAEKVDKATGQIKPAVNEALTEAQKVVSKNTTQAAAIYAHKGGGRKGYATGRMYKSIVKDGRVTWKGQMAEVKGGFNLREPGGYHSIFIMYGTPRMKKDTKIYNAIKGKATRDEIAKVEEKAMKKYLGW